MTILELHFLALYIVETRIIKNYFIGNSNGICDPFVSDIGSETYSETVFLFGISDWLYLYSIYMNVWFIRLLPKEKSHYKKWRIFTSVSNNEKFQWQKKEVHEINSQHFSENIRNNPQLLQFPASIWVANFCNSCLNSLWKV